ncbi:Uncharacterized conserved protein, cupin superfamily [Halomicrobium zhouii]|uniref:Uncharacterized conserved protein, cupin superfamily n=1 Tax=Halomicrobium zhouii TaxID=767519 RepID=A0A1I6LXX4_9EURY|nr:cupin domain-containing protein [Halomicrobium zhouii]SFS08306.1 Uncharacterized conserved protein, cupin superfamily [Halomicrobium zhouii]
MSDDQLVDEADLEWSDVEHGDHEFRRKQLGAATAGDELGCSLYELPEGKQDWLRHYHEGNEEALFVLSGTGTISLGPDAEEHDLSAGDYVALPRGEAGTHAIEGGEGGLRYLMMSTMNEPDITVYPDDDKVGLYAGSAPGGAKDERTLSTYLDRNAEVAYWDEE